MKEFEYRLIKYRDAGMHTHTYFWVNDEDQVVSPYFDSERDAHTWMNDNVRENND
jgi:hypothetical protein